MELYVIGGDISIKRSDKDAFTIQIDCCGHRTETYLNIQDVKKIVEYLQNELLKDC